MCADGGTERIRQELQAGLFALGVGDCRSVLGSDRSHLVAAPTGHAGLATLDVVQRIVARSMVLQSSGNAHDAWDRLGEAANALPSALRHQAVGETTRALLVSERWATSPDERLWWRTALIIWREQAELLDLRRRFAPGLMSPREQLIEGCIERFYWISYDPFYWRRTGSGSPVVHPDGTSVDHSRRLLCARGSDLRQFADPRAGDISQSVWQDLGGYRGLCAEALDLLADRSAPVPWGGIAGTEEVPIRLGRLRAWEYARTWRNDLGLGAGVLQVR